MPKSLKLVIIKSKNISIDRITKFNTHDFFRGNSLVEVIKSANANENTLKGFIPFNLFVCYINFYRNCLHFLSLPPHI